MTALSARPGLHTRWQRSGIAPAAPADRRLLRLALGAAFLLHGLVLLLPLRLEPAPPPPSPPARDPIALHEYPIPPPRPPEPATAFPEPRVRPMPLSLPPAPDVSPVDEPASEPPPQPLSGLRVESPLLDPVEPPSESAVVGEDTPGLTPPRPLERPAPEYPPVAVAARRQGTVLLRATIRESGRVTDIEVLEAPHPDLGFSAAAIDAVGRWRYEPGYLGGRPVDVSMTVVVEFSIE